MYGKVPVFILLFWKVEFSAFCVPPCDIIDPVTRFYEPKDL